MTLSNVPKSLMDYLSGKGIHPNRAIYNNLKQTELSDLVIARREGVKSASGSIVVTTGKNTGRSPYDKYIVSDRDRDSIWWSKTTKSMSASQYAQIRARLVRHLEKQDLFIQSVKVNNDDQNPLSLCVVTETAWHSLFAQNLFLAGEDNAADYLLLQAPTCFAHPETDHTASSVFIIINLDHKEIIIGGTAYAGEIKKSVFSLMNYLLPVRNVLPMHCAANVGNDGNTALFFGLSGTGKTTLSSDVDRQLIGDDEHGWSEKGIFNFEGGCYAKTIKLSKKQEPLIWDAVERTGTILENVIIDTKTKQINFDDAQITENTRAAYPLTYIPGTYAKTFAGHPNHIFFLSADAFGVLPPISKLDEQQAMYYFLAGYTSKLAGTEKGIKNNPQHTFSACFAAPFLPRPPIIYAKMLANKLKEHQTQVWLVNTGWYGGPYGIGTRFPLVYTRTLIKSAINGDFEDQDFHLEDYFHLNIPASCPGIPDNLLNPSTAWSNLAEYSSYAQKLLDAFEHNREVNLRDSNPVLL